MKTGMKWLLLLSIMLGSSPGLGDSRNCSDASGGWLFRVWTYEGGAPPPPDLIIYKRSWRFDGQVLESQEASQENPGAETDLIDSVGVGKKTTLESHGNVHAGGSTFAQLVSLKRRSGNPVVPGAEAKQVSVWMVCAESWNHIHP